MSTPVDQLDLQDEGSGKGDAAVSPEKLGEKHTTLWRVVHYVVLIAIAVVTLFPLLWQLATSLKAPGLDLYARPPELLPKEISGAAYKRVFHVVPVWDYVINSLFVASVTVIGNLVGATTAGYALAKMKFRGRKLAFGVILLGLVEALNVLLMTNAISGVPNEIEEAAMIDGANA